MTAALRAGLAVLAISALAVGLWNLVLAAIRQRRQTGEKPSTA